MTTPRRAAAAAPSPVTAAAPRRAAATPSARPGRLRTLTASALVAGVGATTGYALLLPPAPAALVAVAAPSGEPALSVIVPLADRVPDAAAAAPAALPAPVAPDAAPAPVAATAAAKVAATAAGTAAAPATQAAVRTAAASRAATTVRATPATTTTTAPAAPRTATTTPPRAPVAPAPSTTTAPVSSQAANSVTAQVAAYARAHIGYPYRVNTKGPETYDCAGLVTAAFASAGVTVRHSMTTQAALGSYVSRENLRPGDIVIWGDPVSAVSIYIGNDTIVIGDGAAYGVRTVTITERIKYRSFQGGRRYGG